MDAARISRREEADIYIVFTISSRVKVNESALDLKTFFLSLPFFSSSFSFSSKHINVRDELFTRVLKSYLLLFPRQGLKLGKDWRGLYEN